MPRKQPPSSTGRNRRTTSSPPTRSGNDRRPADYDKVGPLSIEGVEASDLPDKGRGDVFTNPSKESARKLPQQMGDTGDGQVGIRGNPDIAQAAKSGGRKKN